jgi:hypothetical protein
MDIELIQKIHELHMIAAQAQKHQIQHIGGLFDEEEFINRVDSLANHEDIVTHSDHEEIDYHHRQIINAVKDHADRLRK